LLFGLSCGVEESAQPLDLNLSLLGLFDGLAACLLIAHARGYLNRDAEGTLLRVPP
jgi:hypothetical protein